MCSRFRIIPAGNSARNASLALLSPNLPLLYRTYGVCVTNSQQRNIGTALHQKMGLQQTTVTRS